MSTEATGGRGAGVLARGRGQESVLLQRDFRRFLRGALDRNGLPKLGTRAGQGRSERKAQVCRFGQLIDRRDADGAVMALLVALAAAAAEQQWVAPRGLPAKKLFTFLL